MRQSCGSPCDRGRNLFYAPGTLLLVLATGNPQPSPPDSAPPPPGCVVMAIAEGPQADSAAQGK